MYGSQTANPLCSDTSHGKVATYVQRDAPSWLRANLPVSSDRAVGPLLGAGGEGPVRFILVTRAPDSYRSFLDMSG